MKTNQKSSIIAISLITAVCLVGDSMLYIVLPTHWKEVGLSSLVEVGVLLSVNRFVRLPLNPLIGFIYTKVNFRNGIMLAIILAGVTTIGYGMVDDFRIWILLRSVWGLAWSLFKLGAYLLILQAATDENRGNFVGSYNGLYRLGSLVGMLFGGFLADLFGMKMISIVLGAFAFTTIPFLFKYIPKTIQQEVNQGERKRFLNSLSLFKQQKTVIPLLGTAFLATMMLDGMFTATLSHLIDIQYKELIVGAATIAGILQAIRWFILPFISPKIGDILDRVQHKKNMLSLFLGIAASMLLIIPIKVPLAVWLPFLMLHLLISSVLTTIMDTIASDMASKVVNKVFLMTTFTIVIDLGAALGPILGYTFEGIIGLSNLFWICSIICFLLTIKWALPQKRKDGIQNVIERSL